MASWVSRIIVGILCTSVCCAQTARFGTIPYSPWYGHEPTCVSADGRYIAGSYAPPAGPSAFRFDIVTGELVPLVTPGVWTWPYAISADGAVIVGQYGQATPRPFVCRQSEGFSLLTQDGAQVNGHARSVSADGSVVVGDHQANCGIPQQSTLAFRWVAPDTFSCVGTLFAALSSNARFLSADGECFAGEANPDDHSTVIRWTAATGIVALPHLSNQTKHSEVRGISADGLTVYGISKRSDGWTEPVAWVDGQIVPLMLDDAIHDFWAVSQTGDVFIGASLAIPDPFFWSPTCGAKGLLNDVLARGHGIDTAGWVLGQARLSGDGRTIAGIGTNAGARAAWFVRLPCAGDANADGVVNQDDLDLVLFNFGACCGARWADGDLTYDWRVNQDDLDIVLLAYGATCP